MEPTTPKPMTVENLDDYIDSVNFLHGVSKAGNPYKLLQIKLVNDYPIELFLDRADQKMIDVVIEQQKIKKA
jgi:hypothetical protein